MGKLELNKMRKKSALYNTAFELFTTKGLAKTTISDIVENAGVAKGTFYLYFKDKYDIRNKLISHKAGELFSQARDALEQAHVTGFTAQLHFLVDNILDRLETESDLLGFISKNLSWGVIKDAFQAMGTVLAQGVKRGLMSNEAGQGTITMSAAAADAKHPCEQGILASLGVFLDTIVICTLTGFVVVMAHCWTGEGAEAWAALDKLPKFTESIAVLTPGTSMNAIMTFLVTLCFGLFAFTCLLGMISFSEIAANRIRKDAVCINIVRCIALFVAAFGILCNLAGLELGNLWAFSDLGNILIVYFNVPIVFVGAKCVFKATKHYKKNDGTPFDSSVVGRNDCVYWDEKKGAH